MAAGEEISLNMTQNLRNSGGMTTKPKTVTVKSNYGAAKMFQPSGSYDDKNGKLYDLPSTSRQAAISNDLFIRKARKNIRQIQRENESDPLMNISTVMIAALRSFSVIYLSMIGFVMVPVSLTVRCSKCPAEYSVDEMERYSDEELNHRHALVNPRCSVLERVWREYSGALRHPYAQTPMNPLPVKHRLTTNHNSYSVVTTGQRMIDAQNANPSVSSASLDTNISSSFNAQRKPNSMTSRGPDMDEGYQDIISDSLPGETFSGSFPHSGGEFGEYKSRLQSFGSTWHNRAKKGSRPSPETLAEAGFYECSDQRKDAAKCHACDLVLFGWNDNQDVWQKHALQSPSCPYVRQMKGEKFVQDLVDEMEQMKVESANSELSTTRRKVTREDMTKFDVPSSWITSVLDMGFSLDAFLLVYLWRRYTLPPGTTQVFEAVDQAITWILARKDEAEENFERFAEFWPKDEVTSGSKDHGYGTDERMLETDGNTQVEEQTCKICFSKPANMLLRPCSHMVSCESCTRRLKLCPICRDPISAVIPVTW